MAYNQSNLLDKIEAAQDIWKKYNLEERSNVWIYRHHIKPTFFISLKTFYNWLNINVAQRRKELTKQKTNPNSKGLTLFSDFEWF